MFTRQKLALTEATREFIFHEKPIHVLSIHIASDPLSSYTATPPREDYVQIAPLQRT